LFKRAVAAQAQLRGVSYSSSAAEDAVGAFTGANLQILLEFQNTFFD
jgi:hypothetical protein